MKTDSLSDEGRGIQELTPTNWLDHLGIANEDYGIKYMESLHWSLAQFTPGAPRTNPKNTNELLFSIAVLAMGLAMSTIFVSSITSTMGAVWSMNRENYIQHFLLRQFLKQQNVSRSLASRVTRYIDFIIELRHKKVHRKKVGLLNLLSGPLQFELLRELFEPNLRKLPWFIRLAAVRLHGSDVVSEICATAVTNLHLAREDFLFRLNTAASQLYIVDNGSTHYRWAIDRCCREEDNDSISVNIGKETLFKSSYCVEQALWLIWKHRGDMVAISETDICCVSAKKLYSSVAHFPSVHMVARNYAVSYCENMRVYEETTGFKATDLGSEVSALMRSEKKTRLLPGYDEEEIRQAETIHAEKIL